MYIYIYDYPPDTPLFCKLTGQMREIGVTHSPSSRGLEGWSLLSKNAELRLSDIGVSAG